MRRSKRRRRPVVPVGFVEAAQLRRLGGTAVRFLARGLSLPDLLDESFERCHGDGILHRLGGWFLGRHGRPLRGRAGAKAACPGE
jgi:hypothetical protein